MIDIKTYRFSASSSVKTLASETIFSQEHQVSSHVSLPQSAEIDISALCLHPYKNYFLSKLKEIKRLEDEIALVEAMSVENYNIYRDEHCPLLRTKHSLISNDMFFCKYYWNQIKSVYEREKT